MTSPFSRDRLRRSWKRVRFTVAASAPPRKAAPRRCAPSRMHVALDLFEHPSVLAVAELVPVRREAVVAAVGVPITIQRNRTGDRLGVDVAGGPFEHPAVL